MMRRVRRLLRTTDRDTLRQVTFGIAAVVLMVVVGLVLQTGRNGGPSTADATPGDAVGVPSTTVGSTPTSGSSLPATTVPLGEAPEPSIVRFEAPGRVTCGTVTSIEVRWSSAHATLVKLDVDDSGAFEFGPPEGSARLPFPCDGAGHTYRLVAVGADGREVSAVRRVEQTS